VLKRRSRWQPQRRVARRPLRCVAKAALRRASTSEQSTRTAACLRQSYAMPREFPFLKWKLRSRCGQRLHRRVGPNRRPPGAYGNADHSCKYHGHRPEVAVYLGETNALHTRRRPPSARWPIQEPCLAHSLLPTGTPKHVLGSSIVIYGAETSSTWDAHSPFNTANATVALRRSSQPRMAIAISSGVGREEHQATHLDALARRCTGRKWIVERSVK
jgi:hypothetical protein